MPVKCRYGAEKKGIMKPRIIFFALLLFFMPAAAHAEKETPPPLSFEPLSIPATDAEKSAIRISPKATTYCCGGRLKEHALEYRVLLRSGMADNNGHIAGMIPGGDGMPLKRDGAPWISNDPGANSLIDAGGNYHLFTHFGNVPGAVFLASLNADDNGDFTVKDFAPVDFGGVGGTPGTCAGGDTLWDTHLASEDSSTLDAYWFTSGAAPFSLQHAERCAKTETGAVTGGSTRTANEPDFSWWCDTVTLIRSNCLNNPGAFNPYRHGFIIEMGVTRNGAPAIKDGVKRFALGRISGVAMAMPDRRTVYLAGRGPYAGFFMFVADDRKDLSSGTLYIAKWRQQPHGAFINWVPLGRGTDQGIAMILDLRPDLSDIFDIADPMVCPAGYRIIKAGPSGPNCLRLRDGKNGSSISPKFGTKVNPLMAAAFLEPLRYGAFLGGTTEWSNVKGMAYDDDHHALFIAVGGVTGSMLNNLDPVNDIRMPKNNCGALFRFKLGEARDTVGNKIKSQFAASWVEQEAAGVALSPGLPYAAENGCHPDFIAGPDNVRYIGHNILLIGENGKLHFNNYAWAYDVKRKMLTRIASAPTGAGIAGDFATLDAMFRFYLFMNIQHPMNGPALNVEGTPVNGPLLNGATDQQRKGYIGYLSGLPTLGR